jgi:hypothetical protein
MSMLGFSLISDSLHSCLELLLIEEVVVLQGGQVAIEFEDKGTSCGNVVPYDFSIRHLGEMLYDGAEGVAMGHDNDSLVIEDLRANLIVPVRKDTIDCDLEGLGCWENI